MRRSSMPCHRWHCPRASTWKTLKQYGRSWVCRHSQFVNPGTGIRWVIGMRTGTSLRVTLFPGSGRKTARTLRRGGAAALSPRLPCGTLKGAKNLRDNLDGCRHIDNEYVHRTPTSPRIAESHPKHTKLFLFPADIDSNG